MTEKLLVPDIGDFENVEVIEILVKEGQEIKKNDPLVTIESDKSSVEIPSTIEGKIEKIEVKIGDKVSKGDLLLIVSGAKSSSSASETVPKNTENLIQEAEISLKKSQKQKNEKAFQMLTINNYYDLGVASNNQIIENIKKFHELGWDIEESPTGGIIVRNIPYQKLHKTKSVDITELLEMISKDLVKKHADTPKEIISKRLACHNAVRAGQKLSENECKELLNNNLPLPAYENCIKASHYFLSLIHI